MKFKTVFLPIVGSFVLLSSSCNTTLAKEEQIVLMKTHQDEIVDVGFEQIENLIRGRNDFVLYIGNEGCLSCENFEPVIERYQKETDVLIYKIPINRTSKDNLGKIGIDYEDNAPPILVFLQKGFPKSYYYPSIENLSNNSAQKQEQAYQELQDKMQYYGFMSDYTALTYAEVKEKIAAKEDFNVLVTYSFSLEHKDIWKDGLWDKVMNENPKLYRLDLDFESNATEVFTDLSLSEGHYLIRFQKGEIVKQQQYTEDNITEFMTFFNELS